MPGSVKFGSAKFSLSLIALAFAVTLLPGSGWAITSKNCPKEPTSTSIASGYVYSGTNCELYTPGDIDSFVFNANSGDTWQVNLAWQGSYNGTCMTIYDPNGLQIYANTCTGDGELIDSQTLTVTGEYTINLNMEGNGSDATYALSLERVNPFPPDAQAIGIGQSIDGSTSPPTAQPTYTFYGLTTGTYQVTVSWTGGYAGTCEYLYYPGSTTPQDQGCSGDGVYQFTFVPPENATYLVLLDSQGDGTGDYSFEVACYLGECTSGLTLSASSLTFSDQALDTTSNAKSITVTNPAGNATVDFTSIAVTPTANFTISKNTCGASLAANKKCTVSVEYTATAVATQTGTLTFTDTAINSPQTVSLTGTGVAQATLTPSPYTFADTKVGDSKTHTFTLKNNLETTLTGISYSLSGSKDFTIESTTCTTSLDSKKSCTIDVTFTPSAEETYTATLTLDDSANDSPQTSALTGTGN
jgi:hypothetical protein